MTGGELILDLGSGPFSQERFKKEETKSEKRAKVLMDGHFLLIDSENFNLSADPIDHPYIIYHIPFSAKGQNEGSIHKWESLPFLRRDIAGQEINPFCPHHFFAILFDFHIDPSLWLKFGNRDKLFSMIHHLGCLINVDPHFVDDEIPGLVVSSRVDQTLCFQHTAILCKAEKGEEINGQSC